MNFTKFGKFLRELRKEKGLTQEEVADTLHVHRTTYVKWESGNSIPLNDSLVLLSEFFNVSIDELLAGEKITNDKYVEVHNKLLFSLLNSNRKGLKMIIRLVIALIVLIVSFLVYYFVSTYNSVHVYLLYGENDKVKVRDSLLFVTNDIMYLKFGNVYLIDKDELLDIDDIRIYGDENLLFEGDPKQIIVSQKIEKNILNKNYYFVFNYNDDEYKVKLHINNDFRNDKLVNIDNVDYSLYDFLSTKSINLDKRYKYDNKKDAYYFIDKKNEVYCYNDNDTCIIVESNIKEYQYFYLLGILKITYFHNNSIDVINFNDELTINEMQKIKHFKEKIYDKYLK